MLCAPKATQTLLRLTSNRQMLRNQSATRPSAQAVSIQTYTDLQSAVARWIKRTDLTDVIPDFIELAEARFKSLLEIRAGEGEVSLSLESGTDLVPLPCDVKNPISLWVADITPRQLLDQVLAQNLPYTTVPSRPLYWAIDGEYIRVQGPADKQYPLWFRYQQTFRLGASRQSIMC